MGFFGCCKKSGRDTSKKRSLKRGPWLSEVGQMSPNESSVAHIASLQTIPSVGEPSSNLKKLLNTDEQWGFDVILLEEISDKRPLVWLGMKIFERFGVANILHTNDATLRNWLTVIEASYHAKNPYHNSTHAADVLQATAYYLSTTRIKGFFQPLDECIALLAAIVHDVDHPGRTTPFLINSRDHLALLYNDYSVLESHHSSFAFRITLGDPKINIFQNLDLETYKIARQSLIDMVLATEMTKHFVHFTKFVDVFTRPGPENGDRIPVTPPDPDMAILVTLENIILVKRMLIKCADVSNPTRSVRQCVEWAKRITEEYFRQTEEEVARGLIPTLAMFDRNSCSIPKSQTGFVDYFVADMYKVWHAFLDIPEVLECMRYNYDYWKELDKQGIKGAVLNEAYIRDNPPPLSVKNLKRGSHAL